MNYSDSLQYLYNALPMYQRIGAAAYKANLDNTIALDKFFNHPSTSFKSIHVAGTNGKGSVSHMLASIFQSAGYKTGLYTSPHLIDFRERIKVNGEMIAKDFVADFVTNYQSFFDELKPSFFELTVLMAFCYFKEQKVDYAIIETGLGGRLDSTNIIQPELSVITNIGLDHTQFLGSTLDLIAGEKAGIIKKDTPVVIGETHTETKPVFETIAKEKNSTITFADKSYKISYGMQQLDGSIQYHLEENALNVSEITTDLLGAYQKKNICTVLQSIEIISQKYTIDNQAIHDGIAKVKEQTKLIGKWQITGNNPIIIADCGHNKDGVREIVQQINNTAYKNLHLVLGFVNDKNWKEILELFPKEATYYLCQSSVERSVKKEDLEQALKEKHLTGESFFYVSEGVKKAQQNTEAQDLIFIGGSTFVVADYLKTEKK